MQTVLLPVFWILGLSGSGKTTLGTMLCKNLNLYGYNTIHIDGDKFRNQFGFTGFTPEDRLRNIDAIRKYTLQLQAQGNLCIVTAITPYAAMRKENYTQIPLYKEIWVQCSLQTLMERDTKGLYTRAVCGEIDRFTGVSDRFDTPENTDLVIDTDHSSLARSYTSLEEFSLRILKKKNLGND